MSGYSSGITWVPPGAVDLSWNAVCATRCNALPAGLRVRTRRGNLFAPVAGRAGRLVLDRICGEEKAAVTRRRRIAFGPVLSAREGRLRDRRPLSAAENDEELVVVRAELTR